LVGSFGCDLGFIRGYWKVFAHSIRGMDHGSHPLMEFPPEFYGLVAALWATYQYTILIWFGLMFAGVLILAFGVIAWHVVKPVVSL
jgi:hypothetical protein